MLVRNVAGQEDQVFPYHKEHIFIEPKRSAGFVQGVIYIEEHRDYPIVEGIVCELPKNRSEIEKFYPHGLAIGDHITFFRHAHEELLTSWQWETHEVAVEVDEGVWEPRPREFFVGTAIYVVNIADVEAVVKA